MSKHRFLYHAHAVGLAGRITRPFERVLDVQAPTTIPATGGRSIARENDVRIDYEDKTVFSCRATFTRTEGAFNEATGTHDTFVTATAEKFNVADVVMAEEITATVKSSHHEFEDVEPAFELAGTTIQGLTVAGREIRLQSFVTHFSGLSTMEGLRTRYREDQEFRELLQDTAMVGQRERLTDARLHKFFPFCHKEATGELPVFRGTAILPLYRVLNESEEGFSVFGNVIYVKDFGRIQLGELIVSPYERRITGLHVNLGSPIDGDIDASSIGGNGTTTNPPPL